jgi:hypothetical protein
MFWFLLTLVAVAVLAPLLGADTRDSLDWHRQEPFPDEEVVFGMTDDRVRVSAHRPTPAAG